VVKTIEPLAAKNENRAAVSCDAAIGSLHADQTRLRQALQQREQIYGGLSARIIGFCFVSFLGSRDFMLAGILGITIRSLPA
jgi:hypothetical protein